MPDGWDFHAYRQAAAWDGVPPKQYYGIMHVGMVAVIDAAVAGQPEPLSDAGNGLVDAARHMMRRALRSGDPAHIDAARGAISNASFTLADQPQDLAGHLRRTVATLEGLEWSVRRVCRPLREAFDPDYAPVGPQPPCGWRSNWASDDIPTRIVAVALRALDRPESGDVATVVRRQMLAAIRRGDAAAVGAIGGATRAAAAVLIAGADVLRDAPHQEVPRLANATIDEEVAPHDALWDGTREASHAIEIFTSQARELVTLAGATDLLREIAEAVEQPTHDVRRFIPGHAVRRCAAGEARKLLGEVTGGALNRGSNGTPPLAEAVPRSPTELATLLDAHLQAVDGVARSALAGAPPAIGLVVRPAVRWARDHGVRLLRAALLFHPDATCRVDLITRLNAARPAPGLA